MCCNQPHACVCQCGSNLAFQSNMMSRLRLGGSSGVVSSIHVRFVLHIGCGEVHVHSSHYWMNLGWMPYKMGANLRRGLGSISIHP